MELDYLQISPCGRCITATVSPAIVSDTRFLLGLYFGIHESAGSRNNRNDHKHIGEKVQQHDARSFSSAVSPIR